MTYGKKGNIWKNILFSRGMALAVLFLIVFVGFGLVSIARKSIEAARDRKSSEIQAAALQEKSSELAKKLAEINTPDGREAALREQFPVVKSGEHVVVITDQADTTKPDVPLEESKTASGGFWHFLKNIFH